MINDKNALLKNKELLGEDFSNQKTDMLKTNTQSKRLLLMYWTLLFKLLSIVHQNEKRNNEEDRGESPVIS